MPTPRLVAMSGEPATRHLSDDEPLNQNPLELFSTLPIKT